MAKNSYNLPFENIIFIDTNNPIDEKLLFSHCTQAQLCSGISLIVRPENSSKNDGGYIFNLCNVDKAYNFHALSGKLIFSLPTLGQTLDFINHSSGRKFDTASLLISEDINFLLFSEQLNS